MLTVEEYLSLDACSREKVVTYEILELLNFNDLEEELDQACMFVYRKLLGKSTEKMSYYTGTQEYYAINTLIDYFPLHRIEEICNKYPSFYEHFSKNIFLTDEFVIKNRDKNWSYFHLSKCDNISIRAVEETMDEKWYYPSVLQFKKVSKKILERYAPDDRYHYYFVSRNTNISTKLIDEFPDSLWDYTMLSMNPAIPIEYIHKNIDKPWNMEIVSIRQKIKSGTVSWCHSWYKNGSTIIGDPIYKHKCNINFTLNTLENFEFRARVHYRTNPSVIIYFIEKYHKKGDPISKLQNTMKTTSRYSKGELFDGNEFVQWKIEPEYLRAAQGYISVKEYFDDELKDTCLSEDVKNRIRNLRTEGIILHPYAKF